MTRPIEGPRLVVKRGDDLYPKAFERLKNPPGRLRIIGDPEALQEGLAVVGARKATPYGISCASHFAGIAASRGIVIVSGGARGCDSASHEAALKHGARTVVFCGGGCDELYPPENRGLFQRIVDSGGALVSEHDWTEPPLPFMFRMRNRLIASLAKATLIVEAGLPSGTFSTADEALAADRDVLVVPGAITSKQSKGANRLVYQGATPIVDDDSFADALFAVFGQMKLQTAQGEKEDSEDDLAPIEEELLDAMKAQEMAVDEMRSIVESRTGRDDALRWLMVWLAKMQGAGEVAKYRNGRYGPVVKG